MEASALTREQRDESFRRYVLPELDVLFRVALRLTGNRADAEDLVQDTVLRAFRAADRFDGRHPRAWLLTIMRNANINRLRKRQPDLVHDEERTFGTLPAGGADGRDGPQEVVMDQVPEQAVAEALRNLSEKFRDVVMLVDIDGLAYQEAADVLGVPIGTVMSRLHRARNRIRSHLERHGLVPRKPGS